MSNQLRFAVENRKRHLIDQLIGAGVFKILDRQLYELSLDELEQEYKDIEKYAEVHA
ncbi:Fur-regulated basic protein FbpA [Bacillus sp. DX1.1]|uniref:Fur-regulated basic protein FbpA n=1 Tax=unclassified Bacillus (in: firmicutes) TaxID=185979 RepID=UPI0025701C15|nr:MULTISPECIES: Fur-regulated basic protein FbpA [unclassified Bacillus (in: firmicutes)]MDM5154283.1 Fur-regulated basic protein FbpA [Bacillus sp. DX1.1]MDM5187971.1 Fur-regulated basic protein FbpA [Bacillus sp. DX4.1]WJE83200.1 Fur-regulated basic protein FbpA [Bacillus sp. DX3.1]